jgi:hypothetical protein
MKWKLLLLLLVTISTLTVQAVYVPTKRETSPPPEEVLYDFDSPDPEEFVELYSVGDFTYYFRESRGTVAIFDDRNDYLWKTGLDLEYARDIDDACDDVLDLYEEQFLDLPVDTFTGLFGSVNALLENVELEGSNGELRVNSSGLDDTFTKEDIMINAANLSLVQNQEYQVSFSAYALQDRDIEISLGTVLSEVVTVTADEQVFTFTFEFTDATVNDAELEVFFGYLASSANLETTLYFDDLKVEEYDGAAVVEASNQITRGDFELLESEITVTDEDLLGACRDKEVRLNTTYTGFGNSILTIEYYDDANNIKRLSSSSYNGVTMDLNATNDDAHWVFEIDFWSEDIEVILHMYLDADGLRFEVKDEDVTGDNVGRLAAIIIAPFMGASGGAYESFDLQELDYADEEIFKYKVPGYAFVPDGSGALIRYNDNTVKLDFYESAIYGENPAQLDHYYNEFYGYVPFKQSTFPVFGMAHGDQQAAFVSYATSGEEYMQIVSMPEDNLTYYNFTYPRFEYNLQYLQVYNKQGWGYLTLYEDRNHFDIDITYDFLSGDNSDGFSADYVGMALKYREYLLENDLLEEKQFAYNDIPIRLDFLMSDVEKGVAGFENMVTTSPAGVDRILSDMMDNGITNINSGLLGWNDGGMTLGDPSKTDFTRQIGRERDFRELIESYNELGVDISLQQDYYSVNEEMMRLRGNVTRHTSNWYPRLETFDYPISLFYYARPTKSVEWLLDQANDFDDLNVASYSISGITNGLTSDYSDNMMRTEAKQYIIDGFSELNEDVLINAHQPNMYLWKYTDRYLDTPVYNTQFLIETDTVPFVQLVLQGTMEMYGPYSNFSFYTDKDVLRMVDYNIYPNFVLTEEPAYLLTDTLSRVFYSTEYQLYEELIEEIYGTVNMALRNTINASWINRTVVDNGIIVNEYDNGVEIVINYTDDPYEYNGVTVNPVSYEVIGG